MSPVPTSPVPIEFTEISPHDARASAAACLRWVERAGAEMSARDRLSRAQLSLVVGSGIAIVLGVVWVPRWSAIVLATLTTVVYLATLGHRLWVFRASFDGHAMFSVSDDEARAVPAADLPTYTVLVPAFHEPEIVAGLVRALEALEYPRDKLEVKLLLEQGDHETISATRRIRTTLPVKVLLVPPGSPQTKPRALNFGLLWSRGELVTIYDAEDRPEPLQLRRAAVAMRKNPNMACLQARLEFHDAERSALAGLFSLEYLTWFRCFLPGLVNTGGVLPLGGTSNHFRRTALVAAGAWDAFNVTEDADLGIRMQRLGHDIGVLDSVTYEEANGDPINWIKQRSRWQKGYLQTALVHLRHPRLLRRQLGWRGVMHLVLFVAGTPMLALCNMAFWTLSLAWGATQAHVIQVAFPGVVYYLAVGSWLIGNATIAYLGAVTLLEADRPELLGAVLLTPLYWILMSIASVRAAIQLVVDPFHWEKTAHGLGATPEVAEEVIDLTWPEDVIDLTGVGSRR